MPEPKAQLIDPQGPIDVPGMQVTGVTTATGGFVGQVQGAATGLASTTANLSVGVVTATKFQGNTTGNVSGLADDTNINVGIITSTSFTGDLVGNAAGLSTTTANIKAGILSATSFAGNFTGVASGITGTPNIVVGIMTGTLKGDGSGLTGIAATNWITNNVTANSSTTTIDLALGNVVKFTQSADTTVSFANTGTSNIVSFIRDSGSGTLTWPSAIKWDGGSAPTLDAGVYDSTDANVITLLTRDEGVTWYGWENVSFAGGGELWVWGDNDSGTLGQNSPEASHRSSPVQVGDEGKWVKLSIYSKISEQKTFAIKSDTTLWGWGKNTNGDLGQNNRTAYSSPVQVLGLWNSVTTGYENGFGTKTDGTLWGWGKGSDGMLGLNQPSNTRYSSPVQIPGTDWSAVITGGPNTFAIKTTGELWAWGYNGSGSLGVNSSYPVRYSSPVQVPGTTWSNALSGTTDFTTAIKTDGTWWVWGHNFGGQLGQGNRNYYSSPIQIPGSYQTGVGKVTNNAAYCTYAIKTNGELWAVGYNLRGELGQNSRTSYSSPVQVPGTTWSFISGGDGNMLALKTDNTLWSWGLNVKGLLGQNNTTYYSSPVQIPGTDWILSGTAISAGDVAMSALKN